MVWHGARGPSGRREARHCSAGGEAEEQGLEDLRGEVCVQQRAVRIPTQVRLHAEEAAQIGMKLEQAAGVGGGQTAANQEYQCFGFLGQARRRLPTSGIFLFIFKL